MNRFIFKYQSLAHDCLTVNEGTGDTFKYRLSCYVFPTVEGKMRKQCGSRWGSGKYSKAGM